MTSFLYIMNLNDSTTFTHGLGPSFIVNRAQKFHSLTVETHVNDLVLLLEEEKAKGKTMCILVVDGGPDWNPKSWSVLIFMTRLFRMCNMDLLCSTSYAPGQSAYIIRSNIYGPHSPNF